jgi:hypothetical protein
MIVMPFLSYQLDLVTPGILPSRANSRKHMRHSPKRRMYALGRPHNVQRFRTCVLCFLRFSLAIIDFLATSPPQMGYLRAQFVAQCARLSRKACLGATAIAVLPHRSWRW